MPDNSPPEQKAPVPPLVAIGFGILAVSTASIFIRYAQGYAPSLVIAAFRLTIATVVLAPLVSIYHRAELRFRRRSDLALALLSGLFLSLHFVTWITSLEYTTVASSVVLVATTPLWVALLSPITIKEPLTRPIVIGMALAILGGVIVGMSDVCAWETGRFACPAIRDFIIGEAFKGDILALIGAWMAAGYILIGRRLRVQIALLPYVFVVYGIAGAVLVIIMFAAGHNPWGYPSIAYLWFVLLAIIPQLLGHSVFNWALGYLSAAFVAITLMGEPVGSTILAYFLLHETPSIPKIIGAILILAGIYIISRSETNDKSQPQLLITNDEPANRSP